MTSHSYATRTSRVISLAVALAAVAACSGKPNAGGQESGSSTAAGGDVAARDSAKRAHGPSDASTTSTDAPASTASASSASTAGSGKDTTTAKVKGQLIPGRSKQDQATFDAAIRMGTKANANWPKYSAAPGAILPNKRIIAYYGNPHSKKMGVIGEYPEADMLKRWDRQVAEWKAADPSTPVLPAIHLVTVVAQGSPGSDGMWRRREQPQMIEKTYQWAKSRNGILFLDIQASHSTLQQELPLLLPYLSRPDVHLGVDPEFYMHYKREGLRPSSKVGQMYAKDINYAIQTLDKLVREKKLPPKVLVVHRFREDMVPDAESIKPTPNVQVVMHMDGWGPAWLKFDSYHHYIVRHPVQYTGFKLFYHNDTKAGGALLTPKELLQLRPTLMYIQYQ